MPLKHEDQQKPLRWAKGFGYLMLFGWWFQRVFLNFQPLKLGVDSNSGTATLVGLTLPDVDAACFNAAARTTAHFFDMLQAMDA